MLPIIPIHDIGEWIVVSLLVLTTNISPLVGNQCCANVSLVDNKIYLFKIFYLNIISHCFIPITFHCLVCWLIHKLLLNKNVVLLSFDLHVMSFFFCTHQQVFWFFGFKNPGTLRQP